MVAGEMSSGSVISSSNSKDNVNVPTEFTWVFYLLFFSGDGVETKERCF